jgi:hypothetical protein
MIIRYLRLCSWVAPAVAIMVVLFAGLPDPVAAATPSTVHVNKVVFTGSAASPVITITGTGFGKRPPADPKISPAKAGKKYHSACYRQTLQGNGKDGSDFGPSALGIGWGSSPPTGYSAGVWVPNSYLDCVGLLVTKYSPTKVVMKPGCQYALYGRIASGDDFLIEVDGTTHSGVVAYP